MLVRTADRGEDVKTGLMEMRAGVREQRRWKEKIL